MKGKMISGPSMRRKISFNSGLVSLSYLPPVQFSILLLSIIIVIIMKPERMWVWAQSPPCIDFTFSTRSQLPLYFYLRWRESKWWRGWGNRMKSVLWSKRLDIRIKSHKERWKRCGSEWRKRAMEGIGNYSIWIATKKDMYLKGQIDSEIEARTKHDCNQISRRNDRL